MQAKQERLYRDVDFLTSLRPYRSYEHPESLERVCDYLTGEFTKLGWQAEEQVWRVKSQPYKNIMASYNPKASRRLIVGAHYDVCGDQPGADDNASAIAGLLETARLLAEHQPGLDYRIDLVAYCLEEPPFFDSKMMGSYVHAHSLYEQQAEVIGMVCYEMIGYFSDEPGSQPFPDPDLAPLYPDTANFIIVVGIDRFADFSTHFHQLMRKGSGIDVQLINFPENASLASMSDHMNYWKFGYPALMINDTAYIRNPHYHLPSDTIDTLDFNKMTEVVNSTYRALTRL
jgi:Zn-dependent M28 family amino/carboxypeptidase